MRIGGADVLDWLAAGMTPQAIIADYPDLTEEMQGSLKDFAEALRISISSSNQRVARTVVLEDDLVRPWQVGLKPN